MNYGPNPHVYARALRRLRSLQAACPDEADQIAEEVDLLVTLMTRPVRCPTSANRWLWTVAA